MRVPENMSVSKLKKRIEYARGIITEILEDDYYLEMNPDVENTVMYFLEIELNRTQSNMELLMILEEILKFAEEWNLMTEKQIDSVRV